MKNKLESIIKNKWVITGFLIIVLLAGGLGLSSFLAWSNAPILQEGEVPTIEVTCNGEKLDMKYVYFGPLVLLNDFLSPRGFIPPLPSEHIVKAGSVLEFTYTSVPRMKDIVGEMVFERQFLTYGGKYFKNKQFKLTIPSKPGIYYLCVESELVDSVGYAALGGCWMKFIVEE